MSWVAGYIGIPFKYNGVSPSGASCWGLCHLVLKEQAGIETPTYFEEGADKVLTAARMFKQEVVEEVWHKTEAPRQFDCLLMTAITDGERASRIPAHVGIMVNARQVMHVTEGSSTVIVPITHATIRSRIVGFYRHKDLL